MSVTRSISTLLLLGCLFAWFAASPTNAQAKSTVDTAKATPEQILAEMDKTINGYKDQEMTNIMTVVDVDGTEKSYTFNIRQIGSEKRLIRFQTGEMKGMAMLTEDRNNVYVYLPGFKKVRRVAAHGMNQTFAGSDFSNDDIAGGSWTEMCVPTLESENETEWVIRCTPKPDKKAVYNYLLFTILKENFNQRKAEYYNSDGKHYKTLFNDKMKHWDCGFDRFSVVTMTDELTGHKTILELQEFKANQGLKESEFSVRKLKWGR